MQSWKHWTDLLALFNSPSHPIHPSTHYPHATTLYLCQFHKTYFSILSYKISTPERVSQWHKPLQEYQKLKSTQQKQVLLPNLTTKNKSNHVRTNQAIQSNPKQKEKKINQLQSNSFSDPESKN